MRRIHALSVLALAGALLITAATLSVKAADTTQPSAKVGSISGKVVDAEGAPVAGAMVNYRVPAAKPAKDKDKDKKKNAEGPTTEPKKKDAPKGVLTAEDGTFTLTNVPEGKYTVFANKKGVGNGSVKNVEVTADNETKLEAPITLIAPKKKN